MLEGVRPPRLAVAVQLAEQHDRYLLVHRRYLGLAGDVRDGLVRGLPLVVPVYQLQVIDDGEGTLPLSPSEGDAYNIGLNYHTASFTLGYTF